MDLLIQFAAALLSSFCFCALYSVPRKQYWVCALLGGTSWLIYCLLSEVAGVILSTFVGTAVIVLLARILAAVRKCPVSILMIPGFIPLAPGSAIYYTAYYFVHSDLSKTAEYGILTVEIAVAIVLGIIVVFALPIRRIIRFFRALQKKKAG